VTLNTEHKDTTAFCEYSRDSRTNSSCFVVYWITKINSIQFIFNNVQSQRPGSQLEGEVLITRENKNKTYHINKTNNGILKSLITHYN